VTAQLEQLCQVLRVAREARGFEAQDDADVAEGHLGHQVLEAGAVGEAGGRDAEVIQNGDGGRPAKGDRLVAQPHLDVGAFRVAAHLLRTRLADVDDRGARQSDGQ
jgi:hypothetical protein